LDQDKVMCNVELYDLVDVTIWLRTTYIDNLWVLFFIFTSSSNWHGKVMTPRKSSWCPSLSE
jgi:hypothetical protein